MLNSGIFLTFETAFFSSQKQLFFLYQQWLSEDTSNNAFDYLE